MGEKVAPAEWREALRILDIFVRSWGLPLPEEINLSLRKRYPIHEGLILKLIPLKELLAPPEIGEDCSREDIETLYYYFAIHEYPKLRARVLFGEFGRLQDEFPALYRLLRALSKYSKQFSFTLEE